MTGKEKRRELAGKTGVTSKKLSRNKVLSTSHCKRSLPGRFTLFRDTIASKRSKEPEIKTIRKFRKWEGALDSLAQGKIS